MGAPVSACAIILMDFHKRSFSNISDSMSSILNGNYMISTTIGKGQLVCQYHFDDFKASPLGKVVGHLAHQNLGMSKFAMDLLYFCLSWKGNLAH